MYITMEQSSAFKQLWEILLFSNADVSLTHFSRVSHFYTLWKRQKTFGFLLWVASLVALHIFCVHTYNIYGEVSAHCYG